MYMKPHAMAEAVGIHIKGHTHLGAYEEYTPLSESLGVSVSVASALLLACWLLRLRLMLCALTAVCISQTLPSSDASSSAL